MIDEKIYDKDHASRVSDRNKDYINENWREDGVYEIVSCTVSLYSRLVQDGLVMKLAISLKLTLGDSREWDKYLIPCQSWGSAKLNPSFSVEF